MASSRLPAHTSALVLCILLHAIAAMGQDQTAATGLAGQIVDPTAPLKTFTFQNRYSPSMWGLDDKQNEVTFLAGVPHEMFGMPNIFRITVPYMTSQPSGVRGLSDIALVNILIYPRKWGTLAVGGVATVGTNKGPGVDTLAMGPAIAAVLKKNKWTYGVFSQNVFSFGDIANTQIQPILAYTHSDKLSFNVGDAQLTIDWNKGRVVNVPLSGQINYITQFEKQPLRLFFNSQYNVVNEPGTRKWMLTAGVTLIVK